MTLVGCGGGGSGVSTPTPRPGATATPTPTGGNGSGPITSNQLVFVSSRSGSTEIYKANTDGSNPVQLTRIAAQFPFIEKPSVSPDGKRIVFQYGTPRSTATTASPTDNLEIAVINTDGTGLIKLTKDDAAAGRPDDYSPVFSADNKFICWTSERATSNSDKVAHIWRMNGAVGGEATNQALFVSEPSSSPSINRAGNTLAYIAVAQTSYPITIQQLSSNALSGSARRIGGNIKGGSVFNLALSPDGARVAFSTVQSLPSGSMATTSTPASLNVLNVSSGTSALTTTAPSGGTSNGGSAWSRDSQTLYFDAAGGATANRQIFSVAAPFTATPRQVTTDASGANYSPSFLTGG